MDRSFLSQPEVIAASRKFVCIRLTTYENQQESELLRTLFVGRSGDVENTTFALLSPDGKQRLVRPHRTAGHIFGSAARLAATMTRIAQQYDAGRQQAEVLPELPAVANVRLALNVAACDNQPLVILVDRDEQELRKMAEQVRALAWNEEFLGRMTYAATTRSADLEAIDGAVDGNGLLVVQADKFGLRGSVLARLAADPSFAELARTLRTGLGRHERTPKSERHVHDGHRAGIFWDTQTPVTDMMEQKAREQGRRRPTP